MGDSDSIVDKLKAEVEKAGVLSVRQLVDKTLGYGARNRVKRYVGRMERYRTFQFPDNDKELTLDTRVALARWSPMEQMVREAIRAIIASGERVTRRKVAERVGRLDTDQPFVDMFSKVASLEGIYKSPDRGSFFPGDQPSSEKCEHLEIAQLGNGEGRCQACGLFMTHQTLEWYLQSRKSSSLQGTR